MLISLILTFAAGYLALDYAFKFSRQTMPMTANVNQIEAELEARRAADKDCLTRYETMVQTGEVDATKLCGPPQPGLAPDTPITRERRDAATKPFTGDQTSLETKDNR